MVTEFRVRCGFITANWAKWLMEAGEGVTKHSNIEFGAQTWIFGLVLACGENKSDS